MKKYIPHILISLIAIAVLFLFVTGKKADRLLDERMSFRKHEKVPYGMFAAYENLKYMFPEATIGSEKQEPGFWDSLSNYDADQALLVVSPFFNASESEMKKLIRFVENGNDVFISSMKLSYYAEKFIKCDIYYPGGMNFPYYFAGAPDSLTVSLSIPPSAARKSYSYPGRSFDYHFYAVDSATSNVLGYDEQGRPNFIQLRAGKGNLYLHLAPMSFTNYFLLHADNLDYYERILSVIPATRKKVMWDEYYLAKGNIEPQAKPNSNWLSVLMNMQNGAGQKPFKTAIWIAILLLIFYVLMEMRRKQRVIPVVKSPRNDSLDFVKTIGRLYYDKGDHLNLSKKMASYFLEHVRTRYKLQTTDLNEEFITNLQFKSGVDAAELTPIITFIRHLDKSAAPTDKQLANFHKQLESFYQKA